MLHPVAVGPPAREDGFSPSGRGGAKPHHEVTPKAPLPEGEVPSWLLLWAGGGGMEGTHRNFPLPPGAGGPRRRHGVELGHDGA